LLDLLDSKFKKINEKGKRSLNNKLVCERTEPEKRNAIEKEFLKKEEEYDKEMKEIDKNIETIINTQIL